MGSTRFVLKEKIVENKDILEDCICLKDYTGKEFPCLFKDQIEKYRNDIVRINMMANCDATYIEEMNQKYPLELKNIDTENMDCINKLVGSDAMFCFRDIEAELLKYLYAEHKGLSFKDLVVALKDLLMSLSPSIMPDVSAANSIVMPLILLLAIV